LFAGKPIIGLAGGIGSGKSFVARLFAELGGLVICSDEQVHQAYQQDLVKATLRTWWGDSIFAADGSLDRRAVSKIVFADPAQKQKLEALIHPIVNEQRQEIMAARANDPAILAYIWDIPLLFEAGLHRQCDAIIFVDAPLTVRQQRVKENRGWSPEELTQREILQMPLDKKRSISDYTVSNVGEAHVVREQARDLFSRILAGSQKEA